MRESTIESYLRDQMKTLGGVAIKIHPVGARGWPDRVCIYPGGNVEFVELKAPGKKPTLLQSARHQALRKLGVWVEILDSKAEVDRYIAEARLRAGLDYKPEECW